MVEIPAVLNREQVLKELSFDEQGRLLVRHGIRSNRWTKDEFLRQILAW